ncbi:MAG: hypothetical protein ACKOZM_07790 [Flavobacteriales bacterium]
MRKEELHNALMHPENLTDEQLAELRDAVARFPFFGAAQIALTRAYKARGDVAFTDQLSQAAIYTGHRASLYHRLKGIQRVVEVPVAEESAQEIVSTSLASKILEREETQAPAIATQEEKTVQKEVVSIAPATIEQEEIARETTQPAIEDPLRLDQLDPLEAQILVAAVNTTIELEVQPERNEIKPGDMPPVATDLEPDDENSYAAQIYRRAQRKHLLPENSATPSQEIEESDLTDNLPAFRSTPLSHGVQRIRSTDTKQHQRDLVDRFIHTEPQIARGKAGDYPTGNLAKDSLEEDFSMITETMAILFAKQGKLDKARKAYRKLMEQHPEKSIYFAAQLKNLEHFKK